MPKFIAWNRGMRRPMLGTAQWLLPSSPSRFAPGTRQSWNTSSPLEPSRRPTLSCSRIVRPGAGCGTSSEVTPPVSDFFVPVRTCTAISLAIGALVIKFLTPLITQSPLLSRTAVVL